MPTESADGKIIAWRRTHAGEEVVEDGPDGGWQTQGRPDGGNAADQRNASDEVDIEPVDVFVPIGPGDWHVGDVWFGPGLGLGGLDIWIHHCGSCWEEEERLKERRRSFRSDDKKEEITEAGGREKKRSVSRN
jgi:hypothetical protein